MKTFLPGQNKRLTAGTLFQAFQDRTAAAIKHRQALAGAITEL
jgi:hypothetical protein